MTPTNAPAPKVFSREEYVFLREEIRHEDNLINARLSWLVNSQSFLLTAFAISLNGAAISKLPIYAKLNAMLVTWLPVAGLATDLASYVTIWAAILQIRRIRHLAGASHPLNLLPLQGETFTMRLGLSGAIITPVIFLAVWLAILLERWVF